MTDIGITTVLQHQRRSKNGGSRGAAVVTVAVATVVAAAAAPRVLERRSFLLVAAECVAIMFVPFKAHPSTVLQTKFGMKWRTERKARGFARNNNIVLGLGNKLKTKHIPTSKLVQ